VITETGGNVGIGTTNPLSILDVSSANPLPRVTLTNPNSFGALYFYQGGSLLSGFQLIGTNFPTVARQVDMEFFTAGGGDITFAPGNAGNTVEFKSGGNVGIGTNSPTSKLEIAAQDGLKITGFQPFLTLNDTFTSKRSILASGSGDFGFYPDSFIGGVPAIVIKDSTGNVGIGASNPTAKLQVDGGNSAGILSNSQGNAIIGYSSTPSFAAIYGENTSGSTGYGVYGKSTGGVALYADGNAGQALNKGGLVKAMIYVDPFLPAAQYIVRCYNGISNSSTGNCGFSVVRTVAGAYTINFGFPVNDRFFSLTQNYGNHTCGLAVNPGNVNEVFVLVYNAGSSEEYSDARFYLIVY
jgi:hypothetical protein